MNLDLNRGHIHFDEAEEHKCGRNRLVYGCVLRNAAAPNPAVPDLAIGQKPWQRYTVGYKDAAIDVIAEPTRWSPTTACPGAARTTSP